MTQPISGQQALDQTDYMKLLMQELTWQDPMKPVDNREFMTQMAQFSTLQQTTVNNDLLTKILEFQIANNSLNMLGKMVKIAGTDKSGHVVKISFDNNNPQFTVALNKDARASGEILRVSMQEIVEVSRGFA